MNSNQSVSATLKHLQAQPEILDDVQAGLVASEESELEEAIRRSLCADYDVLASRVEERISQTPSPSGQDPNLDLEHRSLENSRDTEVGVETPSPDISEISVGPRRSSRVPLSFHTGCSDKRYERVTANNSRSSSDTNNNASNGSKLTSGARAKRKSPSPSSDDPNMVKAKKKPEAERWSWTESCCINDPTDIGEQHLLQTYCFHFPRCQPKPKCLRSNSPFCLHGLGEGRWEGIDKSHLAGEVDEDITPRCEEKWIGLENLGGTCYINSCLQLWFHNPKIRNLVFRWRDQEDGGGEGAAVDSPRFNDLMSLLQYVFASMMFSFNGVICIRSLVQYLEIDPCVQQDMEEFSSFLRSHVENATAGQDDPLVQQMMQNEFQGETAKIITCSKCGDSFQSTEAFYELILTIQGKKDLYECLDARFASEKMDGNNQYRCCNCGLQDATLSHSLKSAPEMICFQFMRFNFDVVRKKVADFIKFPEHLQLDKYFGSDQNNAAASSSSAPSSSRSIRSSGDKKAAQPSIGGYDLVSVLIHMGHSSTSGHYIGCIKEYGEDASSSGTSWYTFNDDIVKGPYNKLNLAKAEGETKSRGKIPAGYHGSSNAYILWYKRRDANETAATASASATASKSQESDVSNATTFAYSTAAATLPLLKPSRSKESCSTDASSSSASSSTSSTSANKPAAGTKSTAASKSSSTETFGTDDSSTSSTSTSNSRKIEILTASLQLPVPWPECVPLKIREAVEADNANFVTTFQQSEDAKRNTALIGKERQQFLLNSHTDMFLDINQESDFDFVSKNWLKKGFFDMDKEEQVETINHQILACPHGKLDPNKVHSHTKIITKEVADVLFDRYKCDGPRFSGKDAMCKKCVTDICRKTQWKNQVDAAKKTFRAHCNSNKPLDGAGRWVGKKTSNQWWTLATAAFYHANGLLEGGVDVPSGSEIAAVGSVSTSEVASTSAAADTSSTSAAAHLASLTCTAIAQETTLVPALSASTVVAPKSKSSFESNVVKTFNEDLLCQHGLLDPQLSVRKIIPLPAWEILAQYFPDAQEFVEDAKQCPTCVEADLEEQAAVQDTKRVAADLKKSLADFLRDDKRPNLRMIYEGMLQNPTMASSDTIHVIPRHFTTQIQSFLKSPSTDNRPVSMSSVLLLCDHKRMKYNLEAQTILDSSVDLVWSKDYEALERHIDADPRVVVRFVNDVDDENDAASVAMISSKVPSRLPTLIYDPPLCFECAQMKLEEKKRQMFEFESAKILVRKLGDREADCKLEDDDDAFKISAAGINGQGKAYENDPEFQPDSGDPTGSTSSKAPFTASLKAPVSRKRVSFDLEGHPHAKKPRASPSSSLVNGHGDQGNGDGDEDVAFGGPEAVDSKDSIKMNGFHLKNEDLNDFTQVLAALGLPTSFGPQSSASPAPSARKRRQDKEVTVSSSESLKDLKKKIFSLFQIAPYDQHLVFDETREELVGDDITLGLLGVKPLCLLLLRADKPVDGAASSMTINDVKEEERAGQAGFSGTKLAASSRN